MFNHLIASEGAAKKSLTTRTIIMSVVVHAFLLGGALYATTWAPEPAEDEPEEMVTYVEIQDEPEIPEPVVAPPEMEPEPAEAEAPAAPEQEPLLEEPEPEEAPVARGFQDIAPPEEVLERIPDVDVSARAVSPEDFSGVGVAGGVSTGVVGGERRSTAEEPAPAVRGGAPVDVAVVEERPKLVNAAEMQRVLRRLYPDLLRDAGVTGETVLKFVISAEGRVEPGSIEVLSTTHQGFAEASTQVAERFKFRPAKIEGRKVRVAISMPIQWRLENM